MARKKPQHPMAPPVDPMASSFEAAILENPDDDAAYLVYADWLMAQNDPRGELIVLQHDADEADRPRKSTLTKAARVLLEKHADYFLGPLAKLEENQTGAFTALWRYGYLRKLELQWLGYDSEASLATLATILQHPSARFIIELQVGCIFDEYGDVDFQGVIDTLAELRRPAAVRTLDLGVLRSDRVTTDFGELGALIAALPKLRRMRLRERRRDKPRPDDPVHEMMIKRSHRED